MTGSLAVTVLRLALAAAALLPASGRAAAPWMPPASDLCAPARAGTGAIRPVLLEGMGEHRHPVSTRVPLAQRYFDQGLLLAWAFNLPEAERSFREAARLDPTCALCFWGIALALGPTINSDMDWRAAREARRAMATAQSLARGASERERAYIAALATRHVPSSLDREALDESYARAMGELSRRYPDDADAAVLYADALMNLNPWDYWSRDGEARPWTPRIVALLEGVLARVPEHPGANHLYIHAMEASPHPERALPSAQRVLRLAPGAGHLVHMAAHIHLRLGRYRDMSEANRKAIEADLAYLRRTSADPAYAVGYLAHNYHFLWFSLTLEGRGAEAMAVATTLAGQADEGTLRQPRYALLQQFRALPYFTGVRFGRWQDILDLPRPAPDLSYVLGAWHYARGVAQSRQGRAADARRELRLLEQAATRPQLARYRLKNVNPLADLLKIAVHLLRGEIALAAGDTAGALAQMEQAVALEDGLAEDEPPAWYAPARHHLGAALLAAGQAAAAERTYREDLKRYPDNGWSLAGLAQSLRRQGRLAEAQDADARLRGAWAGADVAPPDKR